METNNVVNQAKGLSKWFSVSVEIRVLGHLIWSYVKSSEK